MITPEAGIIMARSHQIIIYYLFQGDTDDMTVCYWARDVWRNVIDPYPPDGKLFLSELLSLFKHSDIFSNTEYGKLKNTGRHF